MNLDKINVCPKYYLKTDYSHHNGHAIITIVGKDDGLVKVMFLEDYRPLGAKGDASWIEPEKIVEEIN